MRKEFAAIRKPIRVVVGAQSGAAIRAGALQFHSGCGCRAIPHLTGFNGEMAKK